MMARGKPDISILWRRYASARGAQELHDLWEALVPFVRGRAGLWAVQRGLQPHSGDDFMSYATAAIPPVVMRFNGKGSLLKYTAKRTLFAAIHEMRTVTRTRRVGKEIPNEFMHLRAARQKDRRPTERLYDILDRLAPRTRYVIEAAYLGGKQKKDIASSLGISPSRVSQIICGAFKQMRKEAGTYV